MKEVDYLIIGQGLAGTLLTYNLIKAGQSVFVIDEGKETTSSKIAAGIYNPITGRRMVKTWMADVLFPYLEEYYTELEVFLNKNFLYKKPVFRPFESLGDQNYWFGQSSDEAFKNLIHICKDVTSVEEHFHAPFGGFETKQSGYIHVSELIKTFRNYLFEHSILLEKPFKHQELITAENCVNYQNIKAKRIVFCEGFSAKINPLFNYLPIEGTKGQILDVVIEKYSLKTIVNKRIFVVPEAGYQRIGSTYERDFKDTEPSQEAASEIIGKLDSVLKSPYHIINQKSAVRPTVVDRKPVLGKHPFLNQVYIFNGLGTKGVSLAPYFSKQMTNFLLYGKPIMNEVDIRRFAYLYL